MENAHSSAYGSIKNNGKSIEVKSVYIAPPSPTLKINQVMDAEEANGKEIYRLGFGGSPLPPCKELVDAYREHLWQTSYPEIQGMLKCRQGIAKFYKKNFSINFDAEDIFVFPGSKEAIFQILSILEGPLLLPAPSWVSYAPQAKMIGKEVYWIETQQGNDYKLTPSALKKTSELIEDKQKILILNSPNNPVGYVYTKEELTELASVCKEENILVIFDGIYAHPKDFEDSPFTSMYSIYPEGCFFSGGLSKIFSCGGWRFGFIALPQNISSSKLKSALTYKMSETVSGVNLPLQYAAVSAYEANESILAYLIKVNNIYRHITRYMWKRLTDSGLNCPKPYGAFYLFLSFDNFAASLSKHGIHDSVSLTERLRSLGIFALPGVNFGLSPSNLAIRISCTDFDGKKVLEASEGSSLDNNFIHDYTPCIKRACDAFESFLSGL